MAALALALALLGGPAAAQIRYEVDPYGRPLGRTETQGGVQRHYDAYGQYDGRSERSAGGGVLRHYDAEGRYLGREEVERDFRRRPSPYPPQTPPYLPPGTQIYVDPGPLLQPQPPMAEPPPRHNTPWFNDRARRN